MTDTTWQPPKVRYYCPLPDCTWVYDEPAPWTGGISPYTALHLRTVETEEEVRAHLSGHSPLDWAREVARLNDVRANVARELGPDSPIGAMIGAAASHDSPAAVSWRACLDWLSNA